MALAVSAEQQVAQRGSFLGFSGQDVVFVEREVCAFVAGNCIQFVSLHPDVPAPPRLLNPAGRSISALAVTAAPVPLPKPQPAETAAPLGPAPDDSRADLRQKLGRATSGGGGDSGGDDFDNELREETGSLDGDGDGDDDAGEEVVFLAFASHGPEPLIRVVEYPSLRHVAEFSGSDAAQLPYQALAFSRDGRRLASLSSRPELALQVWDIADGKPVACRDLAAEINPVDLPSHHDKVQMSFCPVDSTALCITAGRMALLMTHEHRSGFDMEQFTLHYLDVQNSVRGVVAHVWGPWNGVEGASGGGGSGSGAGAAAAAAGGARGLTGTRGSRRDLLAAGGRSSVPPTRGSDAGTLGASRTGTQQRSRMGAQGDAGHPDHSKHQAPDSPRTRALRSSPEKARMLWLLTAAGELFGTPIAQYNLRGLHDGGTVALSAFFDMQELRGIGVVGAAAEVSEAGLLPVVGSSGAIVWMEWRRGAGTRRNDDRWKVVRTVKVKGSPNCIAKSTTLVAVGCSTGALYAVSVSGDSVSKVLSGHGETQITGLCELSPSRFVSADSEGTMRLWDTQSNAEVFVFDNGNPADAAFNCLASMPGVSACVAGRESGRVQIITCVNDKLQVSSSVLAFHSPVSAVAFDPTGEYVVAVSCEERYAEDQPAAPCVVLLRLESNELGKANLTAVPLAFVSLGDREGDPIWIALDVADNKADVQLVLGDLLIRLELSTEPPEKDGPAPIYELKNLQSVSVRLMQGLIQAATRLRNADKDDAKGMLLCCRMPNGAAVFGSILLQAPISDGSMTVFGTLANIPTPDDMSTVAVMASSDTGKVVGLCRDGRVVGYSGSQGGFFIICEDLAWTMRSRSCAVMIGSRPNDGSLTVAATLDGSFWRGSVPDSGSALDVSQAFAKAVQKRLPEIVSETGTQMMTPRQVVPVFQRLVELQIAERRKHHLNENLAYTKALKPIADKLKTLVRENDEASELERLPAEELIVDAPRYDALKKDTDVRVQQDEKALTSDRIACEERQELLHKECFSSMEIQHTVLSPFGVDPKAPHVSNFASRGTLASRDALLKKIMNMRRIELIAQKIEKSPLPSEFPTTFEGSLRENSVTIPEVEDSDRAPKEGEAEDAPKASDDADDDAEEGGAEQNDADDEEEEKSIWEVPARSLLYHSFDVGTLQRRVTQAHLLGVREVQVASEFNAKLEDAVGRKRMVIDQIDDKIDRIVEIVKEVDALSEAQRVHGEIMVAGIPPKVEGKEGGDKKDGASKPAAAKDAAKAAEEAKEKEDGGDAAEEEVAGLQVAVPGRTALSPDEEPELHITVPQEEIDAINAEFSAAIAEQQQAAEAKETEDPMARMRKQRNQSGLRVMMGAVGGDAGFGVLAASGLGVDSLPPTPTGWGKPDELIDDAMRKAMKNFRSRLEDLYEQREKNLKALETELKNLNGQIVELKKEFDETLTILEQEKLLTRLEIQKFHLLRSIHLRRVAEAVAGASDLLRLASAQAELRDKSQHGRTLLRAQTRELGQLRKIQEQAVAEDRLADKAARRDIEREYREFLEPLWKYYRQRGRSDRPNSGRSQASTMTTASEFPTFENDQGAQALLAQFAELPVDAIQFVRDMKMSKIEAERAIKVRANTIREQKLLHEHLSTTSHRIQHDILNLEREFREKWEQRVRNIRNADILLELRQGQVEIGGDAADQGAVESTVNTAFVPDTVVEGYNRIVRDRGEERVELLKDLAKVKQGILRQKWENERLSMLAEDLVDKTKYFQLLRLTKSLQENIKDIASDSAGASQSMEVRKLEARAKRSTVVHGTQVEEKRGKIAQYKRLVKEKTMENDRLAHSLVQLREAVSQRRVVYESANKSAPQGVKRATKDSGQKISAARKLNEIVKAQHDEIEVLRTALAKRRQKAFPFLSPEDAGRTDVSYVQWETGGDSAPNSWTPRGVDPGASTPLTTLEFGAPPLSTTRTGQS